jgi:uncharacterized protein YbjT (DUF2867 family)
MRIVVVGGTGLVGAQLVKTLRHRGLDVLAASSRLGIDTITGQGLSSALAGARVVVDVTNSRSFDDATALQFFHASSAEVAAALADLSTAEPRNRMIEFAGPETFRLNDIVSQVMHAAADSRDVVMDPQARYFGARLREDTLTPDEGAILGVGRFADWLNTRSARVSALR